MCGICGVLNLDGSPGANGSVRGMQEALAHRGPDGEGVVASGAIVVGHRRLSIIDVAGSPQPMVDPLTRCVLTYNGEIYNYQELREQCLADGDRFDTQGDTEVLLKLLARHGEAALTKLNGIFAFGFWDPRRSSLLLVRDRLGVKPLYYVSDGQRLAFASEIKAFAALPWFSPALNEQSVASFLVYSNVHGRETLLRGVQRVESGEIVAVRVGEELRRRRYWSLPEPRLESDVAEGDAENALAALMEDSVRLQMVSDVPVGSLCSGGLDSSLISALCVRRAGHNFNTFNATFPQGPPFDESEYARQVAGHIGSVHHEVVVDGAMVADALVSLVWHNDEPIHHSSSVAIYYVAAEAARRVKVLLSGEGADELLAGYPRYRILNVARMARTPWIGPGLRLAARLLPNRRRREKLMEHLALDVRRAILFNVVTVRMAALEEALQPAWRDRLSEAPFEFEEKLLGEGPDDAESLFRRMLRFDQGTYLATSLDRLDKMLMAASIEGRVPFLDHRLPELTARLPLSTMLRRGRGKYVLRRVARRWLPVDIIERRKWGFGLPLADVLRQPVLRPHVEALWKSSSPAASVFDPTALQRLWNDLHRGQDEAAEILWRAMNLDIWLRLFVDRSLRPSAPPAMASVVASNTQS